MRKIIYTICTVAIISAPLFILAQAETGGGPGAGGGTPTPPAPTMAFGIQNPFKGGSDLTSIINTILHSVIMPLAAVVIVIFIILAGFKYVTAQGKPEEIKKANQALLYVLIGAAVLLGAEGISLAIKHTIDPLINL